MDPHGNDIDHFFSGADHHEHTDQRTVITDEQYNLRTQRREERRRKARKRRRAMISVLVTVILVGTGGFVVSNYAGSMISGWWSPKSSTSAAATSNCPLPGATDVEISVNQGDSGAKIGETLAEACVIADQNDFVVEYQNNPQATGIQPGTYELAQQITAAEAIAVLMDPTNRVDFVLTIPEGWTFAEVKEKVQAVLGVSAEDIDKALKNTSKAGLPKAANGIYEGWLEPGQYVYARDVKLRDVFKEMIERRVKTLKHLGVKAADRQAVLTKASILQKEVLPDTYTKVARVIENRLAAGRALEMDSTVGYGAGKDVMTLTRADFEDSSNKYNTYRHAGLPPSAINNPSEAAIEAVLKPADGSWMYFVTVNMDTGETKFATNYDTFMGYVEEYREWRAKNEGTDG